MKLDATELRYVLPDEFRVLQAVSVYEQIIASTSTNLGESEQVETGSKNHEVVPTQQDYWWECQQVPRKSSEERFSFQSTRSEM
jgi:hypothetical protein